MYVTLGREGRRGENPYRKPGSEEGSNRSDPPWQEHSMECGSGEGHMRLCAFLSFLPWCICLCFQCLSKRPGEYVLPGSNKIAWPLFIFLVVYRLVAARA